MSDTCDVAIVGGGPAGLSAAVELKLQGVARVVVLERFGRAGGIPRHCGHPPFGMREFRRVLSGPAYARRLVATAEDSGVEIRTDHTVTAVRPGGVLELATTQGAMTLTARRVLIATGNRERTRAQRLAPGLRPVGVMNTAALQSFVYEERRKPFARPVIVGSEMVALSALLTCVRHGMRPVALVETRERVQTRRLFMALAALLRVPVLTGAELLSIEGRTRVEGLRLRRNDGTETMLACDAIVFSGRFTPEATVARASGLALDAGSLGPEIDAEGRSSDPHVFVAGNVLHPVETAGVCWAEGRRVAGVIARELTAGTGEPASQAGAAVCPGEGLRYVVPQRISGATELNIRAEGAARGRLVLRDATGRELVVKTLRAYPEQPIRLRVPALDAAALSGDLHLGLERDD
ncbi:MAG: NAD(P)/FAD-dependent oxidoreductase [Salipiger thiooxidans]|uniref:NAD(P)/FAD-dependent oxidoreductase n=1 Tax=Salipiger thiooxidans TaxID=282683 RepID=UPI001CFBD29A|nr:NAD(P)/FAD-dependent oxidoreductase [Salipiger thiooxidans]